MRVVALSSDGTMLRRGVRSAVTSAIKTTSIGGAEVEGEAQEERPSSSDKEVFLDDISPGRVSSRLGKEGEGNKREER